MSAYAIQHGAASARCGRGDPYRLASLWRAMSGQAFGLELSYRQAFVDRGASSDRATRWTTAALQWRWKGLAKD